MLSIGVNPKTTAVPAGRQGIPFPSLIRTGCSHLFLKGVFATFFLIANIIFDRLSFI